MSPEIKAAIEKEAENNSNCYFKQSSDFCSCGGCFARNHRIAGAEYGYKLGYLMGKIEILSMGAIRILLKDELEKELQELLNKCGV